MTSRIFLQPDVDEGVFLTRLCEWAKITRIGKPGEIDKDIVQRLVTALYGDDWMVTTGSWSAYPGETCHLPYMCVTSQNNGANVLVFKGSNMEFDWGSWWGDQLPNFFISKDTWLDWVVNLSTNQVPFPFLYFGVATTIPPEWKLGGELVHAGYLNALQVGYNEVLALLRQTQPHWEFTVPEGPRLFIVGHSLGGSLAQMFFVFCLLRAWRGRSTGAGAAILYEFDPLRASIGGVYAYTFGAPRIANDKFWRAIGLFIQSLQATRQSRPVDFGGAFYEFRNDLFGGSATGPDDEFIDLYKIYDRDGKYAPGAFSVTLPATPIEFWHTDTNDSNNLIGLAREVPLSHMIKTYQKYFSHDHPMVEPKITDTAMWTFVIQCISGVTSSDALLTMAYKAGHYWQPLVSARLGGPDGRTLVFTGTRPTGDGGWNSLDIRFVFKPFPDMKINVESMVLYLDHHQVWRRDELTVRANNSSILDRIHASDPIPGAPPEMEL